MKKSKMLPIFLSAVTLLSSQNIFFMSANAAETEHEPSETAVYAVASGSVYTIDQGFKFEIFDNYASIVDFDEEEYSISDPEYGATHVLKVPGTVAYDDHDYNVEAISMQFNTDSSFTKIIIPKTVKRLSARTFKNKRNLEYVQFEKNSELNEMKFNSGGCFEGCTNLKRIGVEETDKLPDSLTSIEDYTFYNCKSLKSISISDNVTKICSKAFTYCSDLERITFSSKLTYIGSNAFEGCDSLKEISIPATVETINAYAFSDCPELKKVKFETYKIQARMNQNSLSDLNEGAFINCTNLTSAELPLSVHKCRIGKSCFENTALTSVNIPPSISSVGSRAFANTKLENNYETKDGRAYAVGFFGSDTAINDNVFGDTYLNVDDDKVPRIAGIDEFSTAYKFVSGNFGKKYFVKLNGYDPFKLDYFGDLDGDGEVTSSDALVVLRMSVGLEEKRDDADIDSDGFITSADALELLRFSVGLSSDERIGKPVEIPD